MTITHRPAPWQRQQQGQKQKIGRAHFGGLAGDPLEIAALADPQEPQPPEAPAAEDFDDGDSDGETSETPGGPFEPAQEQDPYHRLATFLPVRWYWTGQSLVWISARGSWKVRPLEEFRRRIEKVLEEIRAQEDQMGMSPSLLSRAGLDLPSPWDLEGFFSQDRSLTEKLKTFTIAAAQPSGRLLASRLISPHGNRRGLYSPMMRRWVILTCARDPVFWEQLSRRAPEDSQWWDTFLNLWRRLGQIASPQGDIADPSRSSWRNSRSKFRILAARHLEAMDPMLSPQEKKHGT